MTLTRFSRLTREVLLTSSAVLGALCLLCTLLGFAFGVRPMLFRSGSMAPAISTGDVGFARSADAADVRPGDIVSVISDSGQRVTHRVVRTEGAGSHRLLTLKGDANQVIDSRAYDVTSVQRVFFHVPKIGYGVAWLSTPPGVYLVAAYVALLLLLIGRPAASGTPGASGGGRRRKPEIQRPALKPVGYLAPPIMASSDLDRVPPVQRRGPLLAFGGAGAIGLLFVGTLAWAMPTWAAWTDPVVVTGQSLTTGSWGAPAAPVITVCTPANGNSGNTVKWTEAVNPTTFEIRYTGNAHPAQSIAGSLRQVVLTQGLNNESGSFFLVAINASGTSAASNLVTYSGNGSSKTCVPQ